MPDPIVEQNKAIVRKILNAFNTADTSVLRDMFHPQFKNYSRMLGLHPDVRRGPIVNRLQKEITLTKEVFPDMLFKEERIVGEGDTVVLQWSMTGTNEGVVLGRPATGKKVYTFGVDFVRVKDGKIIEHDDDHFHVFDMLWQMGLLIPEVLNQPEFKL